MFINKTMLLNLSLKAIVSMVTALGARNVRIRGRGVKSKVVGFCH
ncbi:MAG TPA: hypothetical protein VKU01_32670 [Bryobacteraceae bacterium]|nr:hypothetical protein [Bryobacteraceae bacterium]